ncbi:DMT family transporter [Oceanicola sp. 22II-s10i]|uniref:DMT family transporter n=1 Tax=Oceanicola sp. 22II-s10i TaxID=1317116 RepID=UPI000B526080|nr:DMT family transporter [Oceanicola sp. 22II-s10i]
MGPLLPFFLLVVISGALVAAQGPIYARMSQLLGGPFQTVLTAFTFAALLMLVIAGANGTLPRVADLRAMPAWVWLGGVLGCVIVVISTLTIPRLGATGYLVALVAGQMVAGAIYDRTGAFGLPMRTPSTVNLIGLALLVAGAVLATWRRG